MYDYSKFKNPAFKNKYEIVFEKGKERITYGELSDKINAICNSLFNMGASDTALIFSDDVYNVMLSALALSKYGIKRVIADSKIPSVYAEKVIKKYKPSVVFIESQELSRLENALVVSDIKKVITFGKANEVFPSQFEFEDLIKRNDYVVTNTYTPTSEIEFVDKVKGQLPSLSHLSERDAIFIDLPPFCSFGAKAFSELLYQSRKCCILEEISEKMRKKHKVKFVITDRSRHSIYDRFGCDVYVCELDKKRITNAFIDLEKISKYLTKISGFDTLVTFNGATIVVTTMLGEKQSTENISENPDIKLLKKMSLDLLYPYDVQKFFKIVKKS